MSLKQSFPRKRGRPSKLSLMTRGTSTSRGMTRGVTRGSTRGLTRGSTRGLTRGMTRGLTRGLRTRGRGRPRTRGVGSGRGRGHLGSMSVSIPIVRIDDNEEQNVYIGFQASRWQNFRMARGLKNSEETARYLINCWEANKIQKDDCIRVGKATFHDFETFRQKVNKSSDDLIRFYLNYGIEPGRSNIAVSEEVAKVFESFKVRYNLSSTGVIKYLFEVFEKFSRSGDQHANFNMEMSMRRAVREEMIALVQEGVVPVLYNQTQVDPRIVPPLNPLTDPLSVPVNELSPESTKKRSRKSHPQRVVREDQLTDASVNESPALTLLPINTPVVSDTDVMQYNYVIGMSGPQPPLGTATTPIDLEQETITDNQSTPISNSEITKQTKRRSLPANRELKGTMSFCPFPNCYYKSTNVTRLKRHRTLHTGKEFKCSMCERSYTEESKLKEHIQVKHEKCIHFKCEICGDREFTSKGGLKYHFKTMHQKDFAYWCDQCCKGFNQILFYDNHMKKHNGMGQYKCNFCAKEFSYLATLSMHRKTCMASLNSTDVDGLTCPLCGDSFTVKVDMNEHMATEHCDVTRFRCGCGLEFWWRSAFESHKAGCKDAFVQNCELIPITTEDMSESVTGEGADLSTEDGTEDPMNSIQITNIESGEQFVYDLTGDTHSLKSSSGNILTCKDCGYRTGKSSHLKRHVLTHKYERKRKDGTKTVGKPSGARSTWGPKYKGKPIYKCDKCTRTFASKGGITYHQQTKHNNTYKYKCETCDKGFNTIQHYHGHKNTHIGVRPHVCDKCNVGFAYPSVLTSHKKVCKGKSGMDVNGELDLYPCKYCSEKFALLQALKDHCDDVHATPYEEGGTYKNVYLCDCGMKFELRGLYDFHKTTCQLTLKNHTIISLLSKAKGGVGAENGNDIVTDGVGGETFSNDDCLLVVETDGDPDGISEDKNDESDSLLVSQPVFPT